jgi:transposase
MRMLLIGYCMGIRSERRLCDEVHLNLAYRWFCRLELEGDVPDHSTFSRTVTAASAIAICCVHCYRQRSPAAWPKGWSVARASRSMPA